MRLMRWGALALAMVAAGCGDDGSEGSGSGAGTDGSGSASASATASGSASATAASSTSAGSSTDGEDTGTTGDTDARDTDAGSTDATTTDASTGGSGSGSTGTGGSTETGGGSTDESSSSGGTQIIDDPFDPASCQGPPLSLADAEAMLGGMDRAVVATATIQVRERSCPGGMCGDWDEAFDWVISYLTWSGGVVTAYKDFQADMQLVVFDDQGTTRLSLQHVTFDLPSSTYDDEDGMVYDLPPVSIGFPHVRAYDDDPDFEYYYQELDWLVRDGVLTVGEDCVRWVADPYVQQPPFTEQYALVFHW